MEDNGVRDGLSSLRDGAVPSPPKASIPDAVLDAVAEAITEAGCPHREGPYGGYDYGHNEAFYGPAPVEGRYVVRDFRGLEDGQWGAWVHQTDDEEEHQAAYKRLTGRHIASMAIEAYAQAIEARSAETERLGPTDESAVGTMRPNSPKGAS